MLHGLPSLRPTMPRPARASSGNSSSPRPAANPAHAVRHISLVIRPIAAKPSASAYAEHCASTEPLRASTQAGQKTARKCGFLVLSLPGHSRRRFRKGLASGPPANVSNTSEGSSRPRTLASRTARTSSQVSSPSSRPAGYPSMSTSRPHLRRLSPDSDETCFPRYCKDRGRSRPGVASLWKSRSSRSRDFAPLRHPGLVTALPAGTHLRPPPRDSHDFYRVQALYTIGSERC